MQEPQSPFQYEQERSRVAYLTSRIVRDRIFRRVVLRAYDARCAITSLKLINGHGRAEVEAAHIRPVEANGPDIVSNGLALSGTAHWMFDRGLISIAEDHEILVSRHMNDEAGVRAIINKRTADSHPCPCGRSTSPTLPAMASRKLLQDLTVVATGLTSVRPIEAGSSVSLTSAAILRTDRPLRHPTAQDAEVTRRNC